MPQTRCLVANQGKRSAVPAECVLTASSKAAAVFSITDTSVPADKTLVDQTALIVREDNILDKYIWPANDKSALRVGVENQISV